MAEESVGQPYAFGDPDVTCNTVEQLYVQNHTWLGWWLRQRVPSDADAEDIAQDTFVRVLKAQRQSLGIHIYEPRAFLVTIARRLVANFFRRQAIEQAYAETLANMPEAHSPCLETQTMLLDTLIELDQLLEGLGEKVKRAFLLAQIDGLPYAEIADELGVSLRTVKNYIARALVHCSLMSID